MTPKEKAKELFEKYFQKAENIEWTIDKEKKEKSQKYNDDLGNDVLIYWNELAKQCALIAVDEMLDFRNNLYMNKGSLAHQYLIEVKKEIQKL